MVSSSSEKSLVRLDEHSEKTALTGAQVFKDFDMRGFLGGTLWKQAASTTEI
jgi:hypothetical protein